MPQDHAETLAAKCGCGEKVETDFDGDGIPCGNDECPQDSNKSVPRSIGGGEEAEADSDSDCFSYCIDERPQDCEKKAPGMCGCGVVDRDLGFDNDGGSRLLLQIPMATGSPMATTSALKTLTNRLPVHVVAAEKKEK
jgi:hypothetical protein